MYLPDHIYQIYTRIWYYVHGTNGGAAQAVKATVSGVAESSRRLESVVPTGTTAAILRKLNEL